MRIDLPSCDFVNCRYFSDHNCMNSNKRNKCYYHLLRNSNEKILKLFTELLSDWESSKECIVNDRGELEDYDKLKKTINKYKKEVNKLIETNK